MNFKEEIENFVIIGFNNNKFPLITDNKHNFVLKNKSENFITKPPKNFKYHRWAGSLKSSQAFAYNVFSGINNPTLQFEFPMEVFDRDAQIDVMFEIINSQTIELFEVKAFEINSIGKNKIIFEEKYFTKNLYKRTDIAEKFIDFLKSVIKTFENKNIYGGGIKQLCSHLLSVLNTMDNQNFEKKKFKLYSFCLDNTFSNKFEQNVNNYKENLIIFKELVDEFLKEIKVNDRIEYCGFLSASEYIKNNEKSLGIENFEYVMNRYLIELNQK